MQFIRNHQSYLLPAAVLMLLTAGSFAASSTITTGVNTNNNIVQTAQGAVDTNWQFSGYYDSYGLTRADVFGGSVSDPGGAIGYDISSAAASAASTGPVHSSAFLVTGANRPAWYNAGNGSQWLAPSPDQANGGIPINPPGNYEFQMNLSPYISTSGGLVTITITGVNADNNFAFAIGNNMAQEYLAIPFVTKETWGSRGITESFSFSPLDGTELNLIIANNDDQLKGNGQYAYQKNPTGFMVNGMKISQASGATPPRDKMVWAKSANGAVAPGSGTVFHSLVAAPEPATWVIMASFLLIALGKGGFRRTARE